MNLGIWIEGESMATIEQIETKHLNVQRIKGMRMA